MHGMSLVDFRTYKNNTIALWKRNESLVMADNGLSYAVTVGNNVRGYSDQESAYSFYNSKEMDALV